MSEESQQLKTTGKFIGLGMAIGTAVGVALGAATDDYGVWLPVGVSLGLIFGIILEKGRP